MVTVNSAGAAALTELAQNQQGRAFKDPRHSSDKTDGDGALSTTKKVSVAQEYRVSFYSKIQFTQ